MIKLVSKHRVNTSYPSIDSIQSGFGEILKTSWANCVSYYDQRGSVGKYYGYSGTPKKSCREFDTYFSEKVNKFKLEDSDQLIANLIEMLSLFSSSTIDVNFYESRNNLNEDKLSIKYKSHCVVWPIFNVLEGNDLPHDSYKLEFEKRLKKSNWVPITLIDFMGRSYYDSYDHHILSTQHQAFLNRSTVSKYENIIKEGGRPPIIVYQSINNIYESTGSFLIDGHHKIQAYSNLKINPAVIEIEQFKEIETEDSEDELIDKLYLVENIL